MIIEKLSSFSIKISLYEKDISEYNIDYSGWNSDNATEFLLLISNEIQEKTGTDITKEKIYVEIFSRINKCLIFISFSPDTKKSTSKRDVICTFNDYEQLKTFCTKINSRIPQAVKRSSLYASSDALRLKIETNDLYVNHLKKLSSKGMVLECNEFSDSVISEYFTSVLQSDAVKRISVS